MSAKSKKTRVITAGALVTLRARKNTSGKLETLYLDYYSNGERIYKFLKQKLYVSPKTDEERELNQESKRIASELRTIYESELMNDEDPFNKKGRSGVLFIPVMEKFKSVKTKGGEKKRLNTQENYDTVINLFKKKYGESLTFKDITEAWANEFRNYLLDTYKQGTAVIYFSKFHSVIKYALKEGIITTDPLLRVDYISMKESRIEVLTYEELKALKDKDCSINDIKRAGLTSAMSGMRAGDIKKMKWSNVKYTDEIGHYIHFIQEKIDSETITPVKESVIKFLGDRKGDDERVFPEFDNTITHNKALRAWAASAGIKKHVTFHTFRHTYAILLGENGANLFEIQKMLAHRTISTTEKYYAKLLDESKKKVANRLQDL